MKAGTGKPFQAALDEIREKQGVSRNPKETMDLSTS